MDANFWLERWQQSQIGFHQAETEPLLQQHWPALSLAAGSSVFVPLCGKSLDMVWLAGQGHRVVGNELSPVAIDAFLDGQGLTPEVRQQDGFTIKSAGPYELWCGDVFAMPAAATETVTGIYDRAALVALPPDMRRRYAGKLGALSPAGAKALLITLDYDQSILPGPPHAVGREEVHGLFSDGWQVEEVASEHTRARSPKFKEHGIEAVEQTVYQMKRQAA